MLKLTIVGGRHLELPIPSGSSGLSTGDGIDLANIYPRFREWVRLAPLDGDVVIHDGLNYTTCLTNELGKQLLGQFDGNQSLADVAKSTAALGCGTTLEAERQLLIACIVLRMLRMLEVSVRSD